MFKLKEEVAGNGKGTTVYSAAGYDYGRAAHAFKTTGLPHVMVSLKVDGKLAFPAPKEHLEPLPLIRLGMLIGRKAEF